MATTAPAATSTANANATPTTAPVATATQPAGETTDPCNLLDLTTISAATGQQYIDARNDGYGQCYWNTNTSGTNSGSLIVGAIQAQTLDFIKSSFGTGGSDTTVGGHAAFWNPTQGLGSLWVDIGGGQLLVISFPRSQDLDESYAAMAQTLAAAALTNL